MDTPLINMMVNVLKATFTLFKGRKSVTLQNTNIYTTGNNFSSIQMLTPYGYFGIPNNNANNCIIPLNESAKAYISIGFLNTLPESTPISITTGEFCYASNNWALVWNNDGLRANKLDDNTYSATLISGEWVNYFMLNRINEIQNMINQINANYTTLLATFNAHIHSGVTTGTSTSGSPTTTLSQTNLPTPATLGQDTTYIDNENDLLNDNAVSVP